MRCNWATVDAGDTVLEPTVLHLSTLHASAHLFPGATCSSPPPRVAPAARGRLANVTRGHRKHHIVLRFWVQKSGICRHCLGGWRACRCRHWGQWETQLLSGWLSCPPSSGNPLSLPRRFLPRESKALMFYTRRRALINIIACFLFFQILVVPRVVRGQNVQSLYYPREKFWPRLRKNISLSHPPLY